MLVEHIQLFLLHCSACRTGGLVNDLGFEFSSSGRSLFLALGLSGLVTVHLQWRLWLVYRLGFYLSTNKMVDFNNGNKMRRLKHEHIEWTRQSCACLNLMNGTSTTKDVSNFLL